MDVIFIIEMLFHSRGVERRKVPAAEKGVKAKEKERYG